MKRIKRLWRAFVAYTWPMKFAEWANSQRCGICIYNTPDAKWHVLIGSGELFQPSVEETLRRAMCHQCIVADSHTEFQWTCEYLKKP